MAAPRDTAQKWMAFGAMVAVAVGVSLASNAFKNHLKSGLPEPGPREHTPLVSSPPPLAPAPSVAEPEADPDDDAPPADDPRIVPRGTARSSLAAEPSWANDDTAAYAPAHSRAAEIFAAASHPEASVARAVVVCRGKRFGSGGDLAIRATFGAMPEVSADGEQKAPVVYLTAPLVDLGPTTWIDALLTEQQPAGAADVAHLKRSVGPLDDALRVVGVRGELACAALAGDALQDRIADDAGSADSAIARLSEATIEPSSPWGLVPRIERTRAERRIRDLAALTGWDDPRTKKRVAAYDVATRKVGAEERRAFAQWLRSAGHATRIDDLTITFESVRCSNEACEIFVVVENGSGGPKTWSLPEVGVTLLGDAKDRPSVSTDVTIEAVELRAGERRTVSMRGPKSVTTALTLAQLCVTRADVQSCGMIRLR